MMIIIACPVRQYGHVKQFTATGALPGFKGTNKVIEYLGEHAPLATWTFHIAGPPV